MPWQMMFFEDFEDGKDNIFENKVKTKVVDTFTLAAASVYPSTVTENQAMELKKNNGHKDSIAVTNPFYIPYRSMQLDF